MKQLFAGLLLMSAATVYGQSASTDKYAQEPVSTFEVEVNGRKYLLNENSDLAIDSLLKPHIKVWQSPNKRFENSSYSFEYPKNMSFEYSKEIGLRTWTLSGNSAVLLLFEMDMETSLEDFTKELTSKFGEANCTSEPFTRKLGSRLCSGKTIKVNLVGQGLIYECFAYNDKNKKSRFIFMQDSAEEGKHTKEFGDVFALLNGSIKFK